jgi:alpha 1,3-glucosidase
MKLLLLAFIFTLAMAVKRSNFRTSGTSSFGRRNRYLARHSALTKTEGLRFDMNYKIDKETLQYADSLLKFEVKSVFEEQNWFVGEVSFYESGVIEFFMDEKSPVYPRYKIPPGDAIDTSCLTKLTRQDAVRMEENRTVFELGDYRYEIYYHPFKLLAFFKGQQTASVNERSLMNFERYRERGFLMQPKNQTVAPPAPVPIIDATGLLMEKDGEYVELPELWEESFKEFTDKKPRGPSSVAIDVFFPDAGNVYGIPEHADSLSLQDTWESEPYRLYNLDVFEYDLNERMALYGSIPFLLSSQPHRSAGFYWNNPSETYIDIKSEDTSKFTHWFSEAGVIHFFIIQAETPLEVVKLFTLMSGPPQLPQYFSLGYHQCRWNYLDQQDLLGVMEGFETHEIPVDVLWLDIEHTEDKMYFTWDYRKFPTPTDMQDQLALKGRKLVNIVDPHIKREESYFLHKEASQGMLTRLSSYIFSTIPGSVIYYFRSLRQE